MESIDLLVIAGGAAGIFGAITAAEAHPGLHIVILERGSQPLTKERVSGGGRCNVTHYCFEPRPLSTRYPRGERALLSAFSKFQPSDTVAWFNAKGVTLKTEADGRMFPITDSSDTIVNCLMKAAAEAGVELRTRCGLEELAQNAAGKWIATLSDRQQISATHVLVATGGCRSGNLPAVLEAIGHKIEPPVPSLFTFHVNVPWVQELAGLSVPLAEAAVPGTRLKEKGPLLFTHWGVSGPCVLRLSAWGARELAVLDYEFPLTVKWAPDANPESVAQAFQKAREMHPGKTVTNLPLLGIPARLWSALAACAGVGPDERWAQMRKAESTALSDQILRTEIPVTGKSLHKDEFVTCGGVSIKEVDFRTLESRLKKGLHFAGEVLDVDGITGGFNFQAAWTTGWLAGKAIAAAEAAPA